MVDMKKSKELFQKTTEVAFKQYRESRKQSDELREKLKLFEESELESSKMLVEAMEQLEVKMLVFNQRYSHEFAYVVRLLEGRLTMEETHLLETS